MLADVDVNTWKSRAYERESLFLRVLEYVPRAEETWRTQMAAMTARLEEKAASAQEPSRVLCCHCGWDCHTRIELDCHAKKLPL